MVQERVSLHPLLDRRVHRLNQPESAAKHPGDMETDSFMVALQCANDMFSERLVKMEALWDSVEYTRKALEQVVKRLDDLEVSLLATSKKIDD